MEVILIKDFEDLPEGTLLRDVTDWDGYCYCGRWVSSEGTCLVIVAKDFCKIVD